MPKKRLGALSIGQDPRPDLVSPLVQMLPNYEIIEAGALDGLSISELPSTVDAAYPLVTRMRDGTLVTVAEKYIAPKLQAALEELESDGVAATLLMCAGTFVTLMGSQPLFKPFNIGCGVLRSLGIRRIGLIAPVKEQEAPILGRWESAGWESTVWTADLGKQDHQFNQLLHQHVQQHNLQCVVLDYYGHPSDQVTQLQNSIDTPVIDLGNLAMATMASTLKFGGKA